MATAWNVSTIYREVYDAGNTALRVNVVAGTINATIDNVGIVDEEDHRLGVNSDGSIDVNMISGSVSVDWVKVKDADDHELQINTDGSINVSGLSGDTNISGIDSGVIIPVVVEDSDGHGLQINTDGSINVSGLSGDTNISGIDSGVTLPVSIADIITVDVNTMPVAIIEDADGHALQINTDGSINVSGLSGDTNISGIDSGVTLPVSIDDTVTVAISQSGDENKVDIGTMPNVVIEDADGHELQINTDGSINVSGLSGDTNISGIDSGVTLPVSIADDVNVNLQAGNGTDITQTAGALDVNIQSQDFNITVDIDGVTADNNSLYVWLVGQAQNIEVDVENRAGGAVTSATKASIPSSSSTQIVAAGATRIQGVYLFNLGPDTCYINSGAAATIDDFPLLSYMGMMVPSTEAINGYCDSGESADIRVMAF